MRREASMNPIQRVLKLVGESPFWRLTGRLHAALYRATGGGLGHSARQIRKLLLPTPRRRSGPPSTRPPPYPPRGRRFSVAAAHGGSDRAPGWWVNLQAHPGATVQGETRVVPVVARAAPPDEHAVLWPRLTAVNPFFAQYVQITSRRIPVVLLEPRR